MAKGRDERLTASDEVVLLSALSSYVRELSDLIDALAATGAASRAKYWSDRRDTANALRTKLFGGVSITVRATVEGDE